MGTFCHCDEIIKVNNLKKENFILASGFRVFRPWLVDIWFWAYVEGEHHEGNMRCNKTIYYKACGSQEAKKKTGSGHCHNIPFRSPPTINFLP